MADQINNVEFRLAIKNAVSAEAAKIAASLKGIQTAADGINQIGGRLTGGLLALFGGVGVAELLKKSVDMARASEESQARLSVAVGGNIAQFNSLKLTIEAVSKSGIYSIQELTGTTEQLIERGVSADKVPQALKVIADTASALRLPLQEVGDAVAQTYGGEIPKALAKAVPALHQLTDEQLRAGDALDVLSKAFEGKAAAFANTDSGREAAEMRDIAQAWTDIGKELLPIEREILPHVVAWLEKMRDYSEAIRDVFKDVPAVTAKQGAAITDPTTLRWIEFRTEKGENPTNFKGIPIMKGPDGKYYYVEYDTDKSDAKQFATKDRSDLDAEAKDALGRQGQLESDLSNLNLHGLEETNKKREAEVARSTEEEFKQRVIGLQEYLAALEKSLEDERTKLAQHHATVQDEYDHVSGALAHQRDSLAGLKNTGDPTKDAKIQEAREKLQVSITGEMQKQLDLKKQLLEIEQRQKDANQQLLDSQMKAVDDAVKQLSDDESKGVKAVMGGQMSPDQLHAQIVSQVGEIRTAIGSIDSLADKVLSAPDAAALKARLAEMYASVEKGAEDTDKKVNALTQDLIAIGTAARKSAEDGLAKSLTDIELHAKNASEAMGELLKSFMEAITEAANKKLVSSLMDAAFGPVDGKGNQSSLGGLAGGALGALFRGKGNGSSGSLLGGLATGLGGLFSGSGQLIGNVAGGAANAVGSAGSAVGSLIAGILGSFASGGYTGDGRVNEPAGIVHRGEYVVPADVVDRVGVSALASLGRVNDRVSSVGAAGMNAGSTARLEAAIDRLAEIHSAPITVGVPVNEDTIRQIHNHPTSSKLLADAMLRNPDQFRPVVQGLQSRGK